MSKKKYGEYSTFDLTKRFAPYFKKYKHILFLDLLCAAFTTICELVLPLMIRYLTDLASTDLASLTVRTVLIIGGVYILLRLLDTAASYFMSNIGHVMGARIETDMRRDLFAQYHKLSYSYYDNTKIGQLMSRVTSDLFDVTEFAHHCPEEYFIAAVKLTVSFVILLSINVWLTLIIFALLPIMLFCTTYARKKMRDAFKRSRHQVGEINAQVEDSLLGVRVVKSFSNEHMENEKFARGNNAFLGIKKEMYKYFASFHSIVRLFDGIMYAAIVIVGSLFMIDKQITPADIIAYLLYVTTLLTTIRRIVEFSEQFERGMTGIERFVQVMDEPIEIKDKDDAITLADVKGDIRFERVAFRYDDEHDHVLADINLHVKPGDNVALVGPSGAGKTTLCHLIPRFYEVTSGRILLDGIDIRDVTTESLRRNIGIVQQDVYLFSGTVLENIEYGHPGASEEEIIRAATLSGAHDFIMELPDGYETYVGERGVKLSGGQKQRISIARVFLKNPPVLILDEATSSLDNESELLVQQSLESLAKGRTTFTIAHRLTTIQDADFILVLTKEGIAEKGSHEELMELGGIYYKLYTRLQEDA
ncbi:MAG: ABC transporter ATP-binding protein [Christensenellales bacterium]